MIRRKTRSLQLKKSEGIKRYKNKPHILAFPGGSKIGFKNLRTGDEWTFKKNHPGASPVSLRD